MNESRRTLYARLNGDATLTALLSAPTAIYHGVAPQDASFPLVVLQKQAGTPEWQFAGSHIQWDVYLVKAIDSSTTANTVEAIAARVDALLTDAPLVITGRVLLGVWRESDVDYTEVESGETYRHVGSQYRLATEPV